MKSPPTGVAKKVTVYAGSCTSNDESTRNQIKQNFLEATKIDIFLKSMLCISSQGKDCKLSNVKVYCGENSRRRRRNLGRNAYVISFEIQVNDMYPLNDEQQEKKILNQVAEKLDGKKVDIEKVRNNNNNNNNNHNNNNNSNSNNDNNNDFI